MVRSLLTHLLVGSEGTLAFVAEAVLDTVPVLPHKTTGLLVFPSLHAAGAAIVPLREAGATAVELLDRPSLRAVEHLRQVFAELHAVTVRDTVSFHNAGAFFDDEGRHKDPAAPDAAAKVMLNQLVWWALALREAKAVRAYGG